MWLKLVLLCLYLLLLFILSRLLEVSSWYNGTSSFLHSRALLDPFSLSVKKLKQLLANRGISYSGAVEREDLIELVEASGTAVQEELAEDETSAVGTNHQPTQFICGAHFYEEVEDTKDSIWLVQVMTDPGDSLLEEDTWKDVVQKVAKFGVRSGVFQCHRDQRLCDRKGWTTQRLVLALPRGYKAKEDVELHSFFRPAKSSTVLNWVQTHLTSRIRKLNSETEVTDWIGDAKSSRTSQIQMIFFSELDVPPLFLSSLAIKFTGRVMFAMAHTTQKKKGRYRAFLNNMNLPTYLVITTEENFYYGTRVGENLTYKDLEIFLKSLHPEMNDVFLWSLLLVNVMVGFELFLVYREIWKHIISCVFVFFKYNSMLLLAWLLILTLYQFNFMNVITELMLKYTRVINGSNLAVIVRYDWTRYCSFHFTSIVYLLFGSMAGYVIKKYGRAPSDEEISLFSCSWHIPWSGSVMSYFFRPSANRSVYVANPDLVLEEGIELLIEHMAVPNLWLQPMISLDYIKDLQTWRYQGWCIEDDIVNENRKDYSSDDDNSIFNSFSDQSVSTDQLGNSFQGQDSNISCSENISSHKYTVMDSAKISSDNSDSDSVMKCDKVFKPCSCFSPLLNSSYVTSSFAKRRVDNARRAPAGMLEFRECSICLENYQYGDVLCGLPCGHNYHGHCITTWLYRDNHCCPICRWPSYRPKLQMLHLHSQ